MNGASYLLVGAKGGCGTTTFAVDLARALRRARTEVVLVDADLTGRRAIAEMLDAMRALNAARIETIHSVARASDVEIVELVAQYEDVAALRPRELDALATRLGESDAIVLVDVPRPLEHFVAPFVRRASRIVVVMEADLLGASAARTTVGDLARFGIPPERIWLVVSDRNKRRTMTSREIERLLGSTIVAELPRDTDRRAYERTLDGLARRMLEAPDVAPFFRLPTLSRLATLQSIAASRRIGDRNAATSLARADPSGAEAAVGARLQRRKQRDRLRREISEAMLTRVDLVAASASHTDGAKFAELRVTIDALIDDVIQSRDDLADLTLEERAEVKQEILDEQLGLGPLEELMRDPTVSEIIVNGPSKIFVERDGKLARSERTFANDRQLRLVIERIVAPLGRRIDESSPMVDARLADGSRVNAVIEPLSLHGASLTIRRFGTNRLMIDDLLRLGSLPPQAAALLEAIVAARLNVLVSGGTGTGKTTFLNVLSKYIPSNERVVTIEDAAELFLDQEDVVSLEARPANIEGRGAVTIRDLVRNALRMRPDRIVVGECRGGEAFDMLQAMNTGHDGSMTTLHANSAPDAIARLETLVLMAGFDLPSRAVREQIASAIDVVVHIARMRDGSRKIASITEIVGIAEGTVAMREIVAYRSTGMDDDGTSRGRFEYGGKRPQILERFREMGIAFDLAALGELGRGTSEIAREPSGMIPTFVERAWLLERLSDPRVRVVDARSTPHGAPGTVGPSGAERYAIDHLPGAVHLDYATDLADAATPYAARVAPAEAFARTLGASGIGDDTTIVAYDDGDVPYAARFVWMCRYYGHDAVHVLAGGLAEWRREGAPLSTEVPQYPTATFTPRVRPELRATREEVLAIAEGRADVQLLETQRDTTYALRERDIPSARRLSGSLLLEDVRGGRVAEPETLRALVDGAGLERSKRTIVSCGSGVSASGAYLALVEAGFTDLAVYDGSWMEWKHDELPTVPKAADAR